MSRLSTRTTLAVLISIGVIFAIFTSVQGAPSNAPRTGSHLVSGAMTNFNHDRFTVAELEKYNSELDAFNGNSKNGDGHRCESESQANPDY